ncbi:MAG: rRNA maturation RNase YbeY [Bacillota bacterium]|jgi:probable rRNA maturation factor
MSLLLSWSDEQDQIQIQDELIVKLEQLLAIAGVAEEVTSGEVALTFVDDEEIQALNKAYREKDKPTDVLSFPQWEDNDDEMTIVYDEDDAPEEDAEMIGDIVISLQTAKRQAEEFGHSLEREVCFLFVHGFLHLLGYDHEEGDAEEAEMFAKQDEILQKAGISR